MFCLMITAVYSDWLQRENDHMPVLWNSAVYTLLVSVPRRRVRLSTEKWYSAYFLFFFIKFRSDLEKLQQIDSTFHAMYFSYLHIKVPSLEKQSLCYFLNNLLYITFAYWKHTLDTAPTLMCLCCTESSSSVTRHVRLLWVDIFTMIHQ